MIYREKYKVELEDIGMHNRISNKRIITIMEDVAAAHSDSVGYGIKEVGQTNCAWVLLDWKIKVVNRPEYNTHIEAFTWSRKVISCVLIEILSFVIITEMCVL